MEAKMRKKAEQLPLLEVNPVPRAKRRGAEDWPTWQVTTRCLDCPFTHEATIQARDMATSKKLVRDTLPPPTGTHRHRYASAAGPA